MRGVIYARYSCDRQKETSVEDQIRDCQAFALSNNIDVIDTYIDRAQSGRSDDRIAFQQMLTASDRGAFDCVIVWKLDRFARNRYDSAINKARLKRNGVRVLSAMERISDNPEGVLLESLLEGIAEYYSLDLREKTYRGMMGRALQCKHTGGKPALGYKVNADKNYEIDEAGAQIVRLIFDLYATGKSYREILHILNERGAKTTSGRPFGTNSLHDLLINEKYIGVYTFSRTHRKDGGRNNHASDPEAIRIAGGVPAIVSQDVWNTVQERMAENKRAPARSKAKVDYLLTGKIFCGKCGGAMVGMSTCSGYAYYECSTRKRTKQCDKKSIRKEVIENTILRCTVSLLTDSVIDDIAEVVAALSRKECSENAELQSVEHALSDVEKRIENIASAIAQGIITPTTKHMLEQAENERAQLLHRKSELQSIGVYPITKEQVIFWLESFRNLDIDSIEDQHTIIDSLVNSVTVFEDGTLHIIYNSQGKNRTTKCLDLQRTGLPAPNNPKAYVISPYLFGIILKRD